MPIGTLITNFIIMRIKLFVMMAGCMACLCGNAQKQAPGLDVYFAQPSGQTMSPDGEGFVHRWLLLEPISKPNRSNTVFTDTYLKAAFDTVYFKGQFTDVPKDGQKVKVGEETLQWHALDSKLYNVKLFRFATGLEKQMYGVLFWAVTVINCSEEIKNVRLAVGSNSASMWWLNGEKTLLLSGDRRMVRDDAVSQRVTPKKGKNITRGAGIHGPGMSDFCVRLIDEKGHPVKKSTVSLS